MLIYEQEFMGFSGACDNNRGLYQVQIQLIIEAFTRILLIANRRVFNYFINFGQIDSRCRT